MKAKTALTGLFLSLLLTLNASGQAAKTIVLSEPTFEKKTDNLDMKVWIIKEAAEVKNTTDNAGMGKRVDLESNQVITEMPDLLEALPIGTHYITIHAKETSGGKEIEGSPKVVITGPTKEAIAVQLKGDKNNYAASLDLKEKGEYNITLTVNAGGQAETFPFKYTVK